MIKPRRYFTAFLFFLIVSLGIVFVFRNTTLPAAFVGKLISPFQMLGVHLFQANQSRTLESIKEANVLLTEKLVDQKKMQDENAALRDQFATGSIPSEKLLPAKIVGMPGFLPGVSMPDYLILDHGTKDGVEKGAVVVYKENIVGIVSAVNDSFSKVALLTNASVTVSAKTMKTNALGIARGEGSEVVLDNVTLSDRLERDDVVLTSGDQTENGTGFPPGLIIGKITSVEKNPSALFQKAIVKSIFDVKSLSTVFIMVGK